MGKLFDIIGGFWWGGCQGKWLNYFSCCGDIQANLNKSISKIRTGLTDYPRTQIPRPSLPQPIMESTKSPLFEVYLRLRPVAAAAPPHLYPSLPLGPPPPQSQTSNGNERFLTVEPPTPTAVLDHQTSKFGTSHSHPKHITIHPPSESRKRAVEKFAFTRVFEEQTTQLDIFEGVDVPGLIEGVLEGCRDGLIATLGVTGSGKVRETYFGCVN